MRVERIDALRFPLIVGVVFIHSAVSASFLRNFISYGLAQVCIPTLFLISGFLFFYNDNNYLRKIDSRLRSIVVPYIVWSFLPLLLLKVIPPQFWYLQELMILVLISPLFRLMHKKAYLFLLSMLVAWLFFDWHTTWLAMTSILPMLFFYLGSVLAVKRVSLFTLDRFGLICLVAWFVLVLVNTLIKPSELLLHNVGNLFGLVAILYLSKFMVNRVFMWLGSASFFIFCLHQPLISILIAVANRADINSVAIYFGAPVATIGIGLALFYALKKTFHEFTAILVGGRT